MRQPTFALAAGVALLLALASAQGFAQADPPAEDAETGEGVDIPLPLPRPDTVDAEDAAPEDDAVEAPPPSADGDPETIATEQRVYQQACPAVLLGRVVATLLEPIETEEGCGLQSPWQVSAIAVAGRTVPLNGAPVMSCEMAGALAAWVEATDRTANVALGAPLASIATGPGYACRLRNNADDGFISEHGLGNAADIAGMTMADGQTLTVLEGWDRDDDGPVARFLDQIHADACTRFTTVLGPEANAEHADHFHFDLGCHGAACTAQICE